MVIVPKSSGSVVSFVPFQIQGESVPSISRDDVPEILHVLGQTHEYDLAGGNVLAATGGAFSPHNAHCVVSHPLNRLQSEFSLESVESEWCQLPHSDWEIRTDTPPGELIVHIQLRRRLQALSRDEAMALRSLLAPSLSFSI